MVQFLLLLLFPCLNMAQENFLSKAFEPVQFSTYHDIESTNYFNLYSQMLSNPDSFNTFYSPFSPNLFQSMICLYQRYLPIGGNKNRCQFIPSCSRYSYMAIAKLGTFKGLVYSLDRLWRCNINAKGNYDYFGEYLFDPPVVMFLRNNNNQKINDKLHDTTYMSWLLQNKEWDNVYREYLYKEFANPSADNRLKLAKISLNIGNSEKAFSWIKNDSSSDHVLIKSIALYRSSLFNQVMWEIEHYKGHHLVQTPEIAVLWLSAFLQSSTKSFTNTYYKLAVQTITQYVGRDFLSTQIYNLNKSPKSPIISLSLSIVIPGLGQSLNGFIEDGAYALLMVGGFAYLTSRNLILKRYGETLAFGFGFLLTYSANLFAAYHAPERRYEINLRKLLKTLRQIYDPWQPVKVN